MKSCLAVAGLYFVIGFLAGAFTYKVAAKEPLTVVIHSDRPTNKSCDQAGNEYGYGPTDAYMVESCTVGKSRSKNCVRRVPWNLKEHNPRGYPRIVTTCYWQVTP